MCLSGRAGLGMPRATGRTSLSRKRLRLMREVWLGGPLPLRPTAAAKANARRTLITLLFYYVIFSACERAKFYYEINYFIYE